MADKFKLQEGSNWEGQIDTSKESKTWGIIEWTKKAIIALSTAAALHAGVAFADDSKIVTVPLDFIESWSSMQVPQWATKYSSNWMEYSVWEKEDKTLGLKVTKPDEEGWTDSEFVHFNFKGANYTLDMNPTESPNSYAVTTVMERCDWVDRKWVVDSDKKNGILDNFPEKKCEIISKQINLIAEKLEAETSIAKSDASIAKSDASIAKSDASIAKKETRIAQLKQEIIGDLK